ncbi:tetratricopeptide repeat protein (macronuclear) [Tetrahymena thermophila SB210]|uniref:Tetratricopeptide repeat protein n=1 Tax=Tetrahymena thermophila (strain SB210) TaxID=312017 RepID=Q22LN0_TETTS|nr:tetratricopeptide repeat protein [Tetrahymena thermophila SB210]EAR86236.2 tetratricopeptide repeat protein [Tetrahymena thermophila SB210]|eukprot:XP_976831.2 tetratricopeptide repeat protein [Tetrahymena thermophila SB210]
MNVKTVSEKPKSFRQSQNDKLRLLQKQINDQLDSFNKNFEVTQKDIFESLCSIRLAITEIQNFADKKFSLDQSRQNDYTTQAINDSYSDQIYQFTEPLQQLVEKMNFKEESKEKNKKAIKEGMNQKDLNSFLVIINQLINLTKNQSYDNGKQIIKEDQRKMYQSAMHYQTHSNTQSTQHTLGQQSESQKSSGHGQATFLDYSVPSTQIQTQWSRNQNQNMEEQTNQKSQKDQDKESSRPTEAQQKFQSQNYYQNQQNQLILQTAMKNSSNPIEQYPNDETSKKFSNKETNPFKLTETQSKQQSQNKTQNNSQSQSNQQITQTTTLNFSQVNIHSEHKNQVQQNVNSSLGINQANNDIPVVERKILVADQYYKIIPNQQKAIEKVNEYFSKNQQNWQAVVQQQNPAIIEDKQKVHSRYQSAQPYSPNLINQGFVEINNPQQFKNNEIEYIANQNQRMYYKIIMRNQLTMCSQFCDPDEQVNGFRNPDPGYDFCIPHNKTILSANNYLYHSSKGKKELVNMRFTLHNRIRQQDSQQEKELKKYQEFKSILESNIPISSVSRDHPNDYFPSKNQQTVSEVVIGILDQSSSENEKQIKEDDKINQDNMNFLLKIYHKKRIDEESWQEHIHELKSKYQEKSKLSNNKQLSNIANIFAKNENIKSIAKEIHGDIQNLKDLRYAILNKSIHSEFMNDLCYTINNKLITTQEIQYENDVLRINVNRSIDQITSSNGYFSYDETKVCEIFYQLTCQYYGNELQEQIKLYNYLPITLLKSSGYEQKWLVIDLKANQIKLNEYDSDEDIDKDDQKNKQDSKNQKNIDDTIKKLKVLSIYTKESNAQFSKHKQAVLEIKGSQKCAYNIDSTTIATNYYQLSLEKMRNLTLGDQELIQVFYLALKELQNIFKNGFHFLSLNPKNIFLHIKATGSQRFKVKFHIDSSCYKPTQYYNPTFSPGLINQNWSPNSYDDMSYFKKQTLYNLCLSFLHIITLNEDDIYNLDPETILNIGCRNTQRNLKTNYPNFCKFLEIILIYGSTDDVSVLINLIKKDYIEQQSKNKQKFDFSILLHNKNNMQKVIDTQINKFTKVIQEFFTPRRIYERVMFFYYTNQFQQLNSKGETERIYLYVDQLLKSLNNQEKIVQLCPQNLLINLVSIYLTNILFYQFKEKEVQEQFNKICSLETIHFTETQLCRALIGKQTVKFYVALEKSNQTCQLRNIEIKEDDLKKNLANKFIIQILKEKPRLCDRYAQDDVPSKIKLKLNERRFSEVQNLIDQYYKQRENYRKSIFFTPIKLSYYDDMINCRIGIKKMIEAFLYTNENFELKLNLFGWESVESANGCNSVGYVLFYLRKIKESQSYVEQAIFWSVAYKGTDNAELATSYNNIAYLVVNNNEIENSLRYHYKALKIRKQLHPKGHNDLGSTYNNIGQNLTRLKKNNESLQYYQKAMNVWIRLMGYKHNTVSLALSNIANTYTQMQKYDHSIIFHRISYSVRYQTLKQESIDAGQLSQTTEYVQINNHDLAITLDNIGFAYTKQEKYEEALKVQELAKKMWKELCQRNQTHLQSFIVSLNNLGNTHKKMKNYDKCFQETYDTQKILRECKDNNLVKQQQNVIRNIKNEINRHVIMTLREINCYLQVNQSEQAIVLLFKIAHLYDRILNQIQLVEEMNHIQGLDDNISLQKIGITVNQHDGIKKIFPYIIFNKQPYFIRIPPRCFHSSQIDNAEKEIENQFKSLQSEYEQAQSQIIQNQTTQGQSSTIQYQQNSSSQQNTQSTITENYNTQQRIIDKRNQLIKARQEQAQVEFMRMDTKFASLHQFIMVLLLFSIGDILFEKIIIKLKDAEFQKQSKEIFTELKYIIDAHITGDIGKVFNNYKVAFERRQ